MKFEVLTSISDSRLDDYRNVPDARLLEERNVFVAEGRLVVRRLLQDVRFRTRSVMVTAAAREAIADVLAGRPDVTVHLVSQDVMNDVVGFNIHRGCLAIGERPIPRPWQEVVATAKTMVVLERVANADNVGGIMRSAVAFGAGAVLLDPASTDPLYRKALRTSMGAALAVPFARATPWPDAVADLRRSGVALIALTPSHAALPLEAVVTAVAGRRAALLLGHEGDGLTGPVLEMCDHRARIPIAPGVDSLNVASAAAVALYARSLRS